MSPITSPSVMKLDQDSLIQDVPAISDEDSSTCLSITPTDPVTLMRCIPAHMLNQSVTVSVLVERHASCSILHPHELLAMIKSSQPLRNLLPGIYKACSKVHEFVKSALTSHVYSCTCPYGFCEAIYLRVQPSCSMRICGIDFI